MRRGVSGLKARDPGRRDAPGKVLKDRRSPRQRGRTGTSVQQNAPELQDARAVGRAPRRARHARVRERRRPRVEVERPQRRGLERARAAHRETTRGDVADEPRAPIPQEPAPRGRDRRVEPPQVAAVDVVVVMMVVEV
eukprot:31412-Pelagococcus_subviridis.AAC.17